MDEERREVDWLQGDDQPTSFDAATKDLASLGALSIDEFLSNAGSATTMYDLMFSQLISNDPPASPEKESARNANASGNGNANGNGNSEDVVMKEEDVETAIKAGKSHVNTLRTMAQNVFGSSECLKWEFLEKDDNKQCILTITRPNGVARSYKSSRGFPRRQEARADAAQIAMEMGALDFIVSGDADMIKAKKGLLLNPFDVQVDRMDQEEVAEDAKPEYLTEEEPLKQINECCEEWRAGRVKPHWIAYNDYKNKTKKKHGAALKISLNPYVFRAYSVDPMYDTFRAARIACAKLAIEQGVIEFIQFGNGQTEPAKVVDDGMEDDDMEDDFLASIPAKGVSLQDYYETLPQPFPEDVGQQTASEINAPAWLNLSVQAARGGRLMLHFTPILDGERNLHGSILRIQRPEETRTYVVDPMFVKRGDAKAAVCLLAMSQGVGDYIRGLKEEAENKLPAERRKLANEKIIQTLSTECTKIRPGNRLIFVYPSERDAFGCILKVDISEDESKPDIREYSVPVEYRTKADAKAAVACVAAEQGLVDILRFKGAPLPPGYVPFWEAQKTENGDQYVPKRKEHDRDEDRDRRKRRKGNHSHSDSFSMKGRRSQAPFPHQGAVAPAVASLPPKPVVSVSGNAPSNARWKMLPGSGSRGLAPPGASAHAAQSGGQDRSGYRNGSDMHHPREARPPYDHHPSYPYDERGRDFRANSEAPGYGRPGSYGYPAYPHPPPGHYGPPPPVPGPPHHHPGYFGGPPAPPVGGHLHPNDPYGRYPPPPHPSHRSPHAHGPYTDTRYASSPHHSPDYLRAHGGHPYPEGYDSRYPHSPSHPGYHDPRPPHTSEYNSRPPRHGHDNGYRHPPTRDAGWHSPNGKGHHSPEGPQRQWQQAASPPIINPPLRWTHQSQPQSQSKTPAKQEPAKSTPSPQVHATPPTPAPASVSPVTPPAAPASEPTAPKPPSATETSRTKLNEFCVKESIPTPRFFYETIKEANGKTKYKVWAEKDSHRLELQHRFDSVDAGYEKLSKKVLEWELGRMRVKT